MKHSLVWTELWASPRHLEPSCQIHYNVLRVLLGSAGRRWGVVSVWPNLELEDGSTQLGGSGRVSRGRRSMSNSQLMKTGA